MPRNSSSKVALPSDADNTDYVPGVRANWAAVEPETVHQALDETRHVVYDIAPGGMLETIAITDAGGLNVTWAAGEVYDPAGNIVETEAGGGACTDDAVNCIKWVSGTTLTLSTTMPDVHAGEVCVGTIACQNGDIWAVHETPVIKERVPFTVASLMATLPVVVSSGLLVTEDANADNTHDVIAAAGVFHHNMNDVHDVAEIVSRTTDMVRWWRTAGVMADWSNDLHAEIDVANWDQDGVGKVGVNAAKYYRCLLIVSPTQIHCILAQDEYNTEAQAIAGNIPDIPYGLRSFPMSTTYVFKGTEGAMGAAGGLRWADVRPIIGAPAYGGVITNAAIGPGASTDRAIALWDGAGGYLLQNSPVTISPAGNIVTAGGISATGANHQFGSAAVHVRIGGINEAIDNDGAGTLTIHAATAVVVSAATTISPTLTCPSIIGGTAAGSALTLQSTSHGSPVNDYIDFKTLGNKLLRLEGDAGAAPGSQTHTLLFGPIVTGAIADPVRIAREGQGCALAAIACSSDNVNHAGNFRLVRARGTAGTPTAVVNGDLLGRLQFTGYGTSFVARCRLEGRVDGVVSGATVPTAFVILTGTSGATERFRIASDGHGLVAGTRHLAFNSVNNYIYGASSSNLTIVGLSTLVLDSATIHFEIASAQEMLLDADYLRFETAGVNPGFYFGSPSQVDCIIGTSATKRFSFNATGISFFGGTPIAKPTVSGARDVPEGALAALLVELDNLNLVTDNTTAS